MGCLANCGQNERGRGHATEGGTKPGDQTGIEYHLTSMYGTFNAYARYPDENVANLISDLATEAAKNDNIGYSQPKRTTMWHQLKKKSVGYHPANITVPCEADCSSSTSAIIMCAGHLLNISKLKHYDIQSSGGIMSSCRKAGFTVKYTKITKGNCQSLLRPGDILWHKGHATIWVSGNGDDYKGGGGFEQIYGDITALNTRDDATIREICYADIKTYEPSIKSTKIRLSAINYTTAVWGIWNVLAAQYGGTSNGSTSDVDISNIGNIQKAIFKYITDKGLNSAAACGILGNIEVESAGFKIDAVGDHGTSFGLCQWHDDKTRGYHRGTDMKNFVGSNWKTNLQGQLDFLWKELTSSYKNSTLNPIKKVSNTKSGAREAAKIWCIYYESPKNKYKEAENRADKAEKYWNKISTLTTQATTTSEDSSKKSSTTTSKN